MTPPPAAMARLAVAVTQILDSLEQVAPTPAAAPAEVRVSGQQPPVADARTPLPLQPRQPPPSAPHVEALPLAATPRPPTRVTTPAMSPEPAPPPAQTAPLPPPSSPLATALADVKAQLQGILSVAVFQAAAQPESAALARSVVLANLATVLPPAVPGTPLPLLDVFDPYRWGLIAALHYRDVDRRRRDPERCFICLRLMVRSLTGELQCPRCF
jgi:hypothetical protein